MGSWDISSYTTITWVQATYTTWRLLRRRISSSALTLGKKINWTFEKYYTLHKEQDNILKNIKEHRYTGIDQLSTVTYLIEVINTMGLDSVKTFIMSDESLRQYFERCVTLYKYFSNSQVRMICSC